MLLLLVSGRRGSGCIGTIDHILTEIGAASHIGDICRIVAARGDDNFAIDGLKVLWQWIMLRIEDGRHWFHSTGENYIAT